MPQKRKKKSVLREGEELGRSGPSFTPTFIYDGKCDFCKKWVEIWKEYTHGKVKFSASQHVKKDFPQVPEELFGRCAILVLESGKYVYGAKAAFFALSLAPHHVTGKILFFLYRHLPYFDRFSEWIYAFVSSYRGAFSHITRLFFGSAFQVPHYRWARQLFLRLEGLLYLFLFATLPLNLFVSGRLWQFQCIRGLGVLGSVFLIVGFRPLETALFLWVFNLIRLTHFPSLGEYPGEAIFLLIGLISLFLTPRVRFLHQSTSLPSSWVTLGLKLLLFGILGIAGWDSLEIHPPLLQDPYAWIRVSLPFWMFFPGRFRYLTFWAILYFQGMAIQQQGDTTLGGLSVLLGVFLLDDSFFHFFEKNKAA